ncbi:DUF2946 domain-containing protein [Duganella sp. FT3S]|uniref:DUF2946 domain-containing protein n=1 Tax=Rugamonas fusca TaxID=2758568 RepID=A0A7W2EEC4_9BURK|nr:DUF2946 domain-containing protein [Rugamonas fusca]MBA5604227.1 DUF2946 domain-containing protein [Rugamonas fusca]
MKLTTLTRQLTAWIACLAILMAALAPAISQAVAAQEVANAGWTEVCSSTGARMVKMAPDQNPASTSPAEHGFHFKHCAFCCTHAGAPGLPPSAGFIVPILNDRLALPSLYYQSPRPLFIWAAAHSRAPPAIS